MELVSMKDVIDAAEKPSGHGGGMINPTKVGLDLERQRNSRLTRDS